MRTLKKVMSILLVLIFVLSTDIGTLSFSACATERLETETVTSEPFDSNVKNTNVKYGQTVKVIMNNNITSVLPNAYNSLIGTYTVTYGQPYNCLISLPNYAGYTFAGWYLNPQCIGEMIGPLSVVSVNQDHTLYARWYDSTQTTYRVNIKANGGMWPNGSVGTNDLAIWTYEGYKTGDKFTAKLPTRKGYKIIGWSSYLENTILRGSNMSSISGSTVTVGKENTDLVAQWEPITYTVYYNANGGTYKKPFAPLTYSYDQTFTIVSDFNVTREGYTFAGWNTAEDGSGTSYSVDQNVSNLTDVDGSTVILYAQWVSSGNTDTDTTDTNTDTDTYTVWYDANGGRLPLIINGLRHSFDEEFVLLDSYDVTRNGYTFVNWNTAADGSGISYEAGARVTNISNGENSVTLYAQWRPLDTDTISDTETESDVITDTDTETETDSEKITDMETETDSEIISDTETDTEIKGEHSITLIFDQGVLTVDGTEYKNLYILYADIGEMVILPEPEKELSYFSGWNTMPDGSGVMIGSNTLSSMPDADLTLYAVWKGMGDLPDPTEFLYGDVDCSGKINMEDVVAMQKVIAQLIECGEFGSTSLENSDVTHDEKVTMEDVVLLQRFIAQLVTNLEPKV